MFHLEETSMHLIIHLRCSIGLAVAVLVARWRLTGHLGRLNWPFPAE